MTDPLRGLDPHHQEPEVLGPERGTDPTQMSNQSAFWTSEGRTWLVSGAVTLVVLGAMFVWLASINAPAAIGAIVALALLFVAMLVVRFAVRRRHARLVTLFVLLLCMLAAGFVGVWVVTVTGS